MVVVGNFRNRVELRKKKRQNFQYNAKIVRDQDTPPLACAISDISASGARLCLENDVELPPELVARLNEAA